MFFTVGIVSTVMYPGMMLLTLPLRSQSSCSLVSFFLLTLFLRLSFLLIHPIQGLELSWNNVNLVVGLLSLSFLGSWALLRCVTMLSTVNCWLCMQLFINSSHWLKVDIVLYPQIISLLYMPCLISVICGSLVNRGTILLSLSFFPICSIGLELIILSLTVCQVTLFLN